MSTSRKPTVLRGIGRWDLVALMVNVSIGSGILGLPSRLFELTHAYSLIVLVLAGVLIGVIAICFAEVGSRFADSGGPYLISRTVFGAAPGFVVGWLYWISRVLTFATICNLFVTYASRFDPELATRWRAPLVALVVASIAIIHWIGIRRATLVGNALTALKIAFLGGFIVAGAIGAQSFSVESTPLPPAGDVSDALLLAVFAFVGFEAALVSAGETRDPRRDVPFAIAIALLVLLLLYAGVQAVCIATVPDLAQSKTPVTDAAVRLWGPVAEQVITAGALVIMYGSLNSGFLATTRLPFAFAEQGDFPAWLARVHARFRTPHVAILLSAVLVLAATLASTFLTAITLATSTRMVVYIAGCAALILLRRRADAPPAGFIAPAGYLFAGLAIALSVVLLANASGRELWQLTIAAVSGILLYGFVRRRMRVA
jgi:amino acid transporter